MLGFPKLIQPRKTLEIETVAQLQKELSEPKGFDSYREIQLWLSSCLNIEISYSTLHRIVRYELQSKLKVPRPIHEKQAAGVVEAFWSFLPKRIEGLIREIRHKHGQKPDIFYWCQDETRVGFRSESGRKITLKGVKPEQELQWH